MPCCLGQRISSIRVCVDYPADSLGTVGRGGDARLNFILLVISKDVFGNRLQDLPVAIILIGLMNRRKGFIAIGNCGDKRGPRPGVSSVGFPVERISPAMVPVSCASGLFQYIQE